jgi:hypothetical protein
MTRQSISWFGCVTVMWVSTLRFVAESFGFWSSENLFFCEHVSPVFDIFVFDTKLDYLQIKEYDKLLR